MLVAVEVTNTNGRREWLNEVVRCKQQYNSWFYVAFEKEIVMGKDAHCSIKFSPRAGAKYLSIAEAQVEESLGAARCATSQVQFQIQNKQGWHECQEQIYIVKNVFVQLLKN